MRNGAQGFGWYWRKQTRTGWLRDLPVGYWLRVPREYRVRQDGSPFASPQRLQAVLHQSYRRVDASHTILRTRTVGGILFVMKEVT